MAEPVAESVVETLSSGGYATVTQDGVEVSSNSETEAQIRESLGAPKESTTPPAPLEPAEESTERNADGTFKAKPAAKPRNDPQARIDQAIARQKDAERRAEAAEARWNAAQTPPPAAVTPPAPDPAKPPTADWQRYAAMPDAPKLDQYDSLEAFNFAVSAFVADKRADEREASRTQQTQQQQAEHDHRESGRLWQERLATARAADPDFNSKVNPDTPMSEPMKHYVSVTAGDLGPALLLYLSNHLDESQRLSTLHPMLVFRELGKLEAQLQPDAAPRGPAPVVPLVSHAKAPIKPLGTSPLVSPDSEPDDNASDDEWYRWQQRQGRKTR